MGPEATAELYLRIVRIFQQRFNAVYDDDFPEIVILNVPIPDVVEDSSQNDLVREMLVTAVRKLVVSGADFIGVPCNSVTCYLQDIQETVDVITIPGEVQRELKTLGLSKVALLATQKTIATRIYSDALQGISVLTPIEEDLEEITCIIMRVLAGKKTEADRNRVLQMVSKIKSEGAEKVILGCTELPLLLGNEDTIDTIEVLAKALVERAIS
jgi:aspartate racemase